MEEKRLYYLAHEALKIRWNKTYELLKKDPYNEILIAREKRRLDELRQFESEMIIKGFTN